MPVIKTVGIMSKPNSPAAGELVPKLIEWLRQRGITVRIDGETGVYAGGIAGLVRERVPETCDMLIVLGGDGTLLSAARAMGMSTSWITDSNAVEAGRSLCDSRITRW